MKRIETPILGWWDDLAPINQPLLISWYRIIWLVDGYWYYWYNVYHDYAYGWKTVRAFCFFFEYCSLSWGWGGVGGHVNVPCTSYMIYCHVAKISGIAYYVTWARVKRRYERLQLRSAITTQNMWFTVCSDRGPYVAIPLFRLCLWLKLPVGRMTFQSFDVRVRHWSSRSGLVFLGSCKMACRQVYMR